MLEATLPPLRRFILAGGSHGRGDAAPRADGLPPRRARDGRARVRGRRGVRGRAADLRQSPVRSAVRDGPRARTTARARQKSSGEPELAGAYAYCERLARDALRELSCRLPSPAARAMRPHVAADLRLCAHRRRHGGRGRARRPRDRLADLDAWSVADAAAIGARCRRGDAARRSVRRACARRSQSAGCRSTLLDDLLSAFAQDVTVTRYATWDELLDYCRRSANPVGRLVLRVAGHETRDRRRVGRRLHGASADELLAGLSSVDWRRDALYVPEDVWQTAGARESDLEARRLTPAWRAALGEVVAPHARAVR